MLLIERNRSEPHIAEHIIWYLTKICHTEFSKGYLSSMLTCYMWRNKHQCHLFTESISFPSLLFKLPTICHLTNTVNSCTQHTKLEKILMNPVNAWFWNLLNGKMITQTHVDNLPVAEDSPVYKSLDCLFSLMESFSSTILYCLSLPPYRTMGAP